MKKDLQSHYIIMHKHIQAQFHLQFWMRNDFLLTDHLSKDENSCGSISPKKVTAKTDAVITQNQCQFLASQGKIYG